MTSHPRPPFDTSNIVPSMRDLLHALATRRKRLALIPIVDDAADVARLEEFSVAGLAVLSASEIMRAVANASKLPVLCLAPVRDDDDVLAARAYGADAIVIDAPLEAARYVALVKKAQSTRMATMARVTDEASARRAIELGAKAAVVEAGSVAELQSIMAVLPPPMRVLARVRGTDVSSIRALVSKVDAALVEIDVHASTDFESLQSEVDPG